MQDMQWYTIIRLVCIEGYTGFKYRSFRQQGDQGRTDSEIREEHRFGGGRGSMVFRWGKGSVRKEQNQDKGITKGNNNKIRMVQGKSDESENNQRGRLGWDLTMCHLSASLGIDPVAIINI